MTKVTVGGGSSVHLRGTIKPGLEDVIEGTNVTIDKTDPKNPIISSTGGGGSMVYPGSGIPLSTGSAWGTSITDNSSNWNTAYGWGDHASAGYLTSLTNGNGTTASGTSVNLGGTLSSTASIVTGSNSYNIGNGTAAISFVGSTGNFTYSSFGGALTLTGSSASIGHSSGVSLTFNGSGVAFTLGSDASQDLYKRGPSGYLVRIPLGSSGDVLTNVSGTIGWAAPSGGGSGTVTSVTSANADLTVATTTTTPVITMVQAPALRSATTTVDVSAATAPTSGQVLTATSGTAATWQTPASGFADPMTTRGDIIIRNASNVTARLGIGASGRLLQSDGTDISWAAPTFWSTANGGTASASNTRTFNTNGWDNTTSTWTATATTQFALNETGTLTARATLGDILYGRTHTRTFVASANNQQLIDTYINPTFTVGANTGTIRVGLQVNNGSLFVGSNVASATKKFVVKGWGASSSTLTAEFIDSSGTSILSIGDGGTVAIRPSGFLQLGGGNDYISGTTGSLSFSTALGSVTNGAYRFRYGGSTATAGVIPIVQVETSSNIAPTSGNADFVGVNMKLSINQTGTASGNLIGFNHDPTLTGILGRNIAFRAVTGHSIFGGSTPTASTTVDIRGVSSGTALRIANNSNTELWDFKNDGSLEIGGSTGTSGQVLTSAGSGSPPVWTDQTIRTVKVTLSSAEILNSFSSAKQLIAAPGSGKVNEVISITMRYNYLTAPYVTNTTLAVYYSTVEVAAHTGVLDQLASVIKVASPGIGFVSASADLENQAVFIGTKTGNPTAGSGTLDVYVTYRIITL